MLGFGMPKEAIRLGAGEQVTPLDYIPGAIIAALSHETQSARPDG